jgi:WD40 repeat protein
MLSGSKDRCVLFWDMETGTAHHIILGHRDSVIRVATSPVEDMFATASSDMTMRLWKYRIVGKGRNTADREPMIRKRSNLHDLLS